MHIICKSGSFALQTLEYGRTTGLMRRFATLDVALCLLMLLPSQALARDFLIGGESFNETDIVDARAQPDLAGVAAIMLTFEDAASTRLVKMTKRNVGKTIRISLDGKLLLEPFVQEPVEGGQLMISGTFTVSEAEKIAKLISGKEPLPESLDDEP